MNSRRRMPRSRWSSSDSRGDNPSDAERLAGTTPDRPANKVRLDPMSNKYRRRLEEVMALLPCPVSGCWFVNGAETSYYYDEDCECHVLEVWPVGVQEETDAESNGHEG